MGHLAHSVEVRTFIDTLTTRVEACESRQGDTSKVTPLKAEVVDLRKDADYLKSTYFTSLLEVADYLNAPETSEIPPATTGDVPRADAAEYESEEETNEELIKIREDRINRDLPDLKELIVQFVIQTSLTEASSGVVPSKVTPGTDAQTDGATE
ncbi:uncharacterized protein LOC125840587 [Solanum verrucosum]|uniref:uncharacterized protein LOC125840587 n=1 Tax=Solanum verrucosum TaxID=315347 RepID=UPI0020D1771F|nr:uncharacterized protein LOC125840587 [Solanum verrucosum]